MPLITLQGAHLAYGHVALLDGAELAIDAGERIALIGRNGTGKSSLLRGIAGELAFDDGQVTRQAGLTVAFVAQEPVLDPEHTVYAAVAAGLGADAAAIAQYEALAAALAREAHPAAASLERLSELQAQLEASNAWAFTHRVESILSRLSLSGGDPVAQLSGGMRKRVALARALALEPEVLFLDEPTSGLDPIGARAFDRLIRALADSLGLTVLLVTHDLDTLLSIIDRAVALAHGKVIADGPVPTVAASDDPWLKAYFAARAPPGGPHGT